jgi:hypothetical protein
MRYDKRDANKLLSRPDFLFDDFQVRLNFAFLQRPTKRAFRHGFQTDADLIYVALFRHIPVAPAPLLVSHNRAAH